MKRMIPQKVEGYRSEVINAIIDCLIALYPQSSATIMANVTARGTSFEVKRSEQSVSKKPVIAFGCSNAGMVVTVKLGKVYFKGVSKTVGSWPTDGKSTLTATSYGYISIDLAAATATWHLDTSDPGDGDDDTEIWRIFVATVTGTGATAKITELLECQHGDIHSMGNA